MSGKHMLIKQVGEQMYMTTMEDKSVRFRAGFYMEYVPNT